MLYFYNVKKYGGIAALLLAFALPLHAQQSAQVKGSVVTDKGETLPGATIVVTTPSGRMVQNTSTNEKGIFVVSNLAADSSYDFSARYVGFAAEPIHHYLVRPGDKNALLIRMHATASNINDIVVVGYGTQKKVNLTGAVTQVGSEVLQDRPMSNIGTGLQGVIPNLNITFADGHPGATPKFNVRGYASVNNNSGTPLILIDGVPGNTAYLNPRDVESVSVLKDAASSAIYGARGAFGVVLITTKRSRQGKLRVNYGANFGIQRMTTSDDFITDGYDDITLVDQAFSRHNGTSYSGYNQDDYAALKARQTDKSLPAVTVQNRNGKDQYVYYASTDWWHWLFRDNLPSMEHSLDVSGGNEKVDYYVSGRYYQQKGMYSRNEDVFNNYNFRAKFNAHLTDWFTLSSNTQFAAQDYTYPGWGYNANYFNFSVHALAAYAPTNPDGTYSYRTYLNNYDIGNGIFADLQHGKTKGGTRNYDLQQTFGFDARLAKGLHLTGNYSYELTPYADYQRRTMIPWSIYPGVVQYLGYDQLNDNSHLDQHHSLNLFATYETGFNLHHFKAIGGYNVELQRYKTNTGMRQNLLSEDLNQLDLGTGTQQAGGNAAEWALLGYFGRINYDYNDKYLLEVDGRYDGSSRFPADRRFGFFPSVSAGWRVSEEPFFKRVKQVVSSLKVRGSYGSLGNQDPGGATSTALLYPYVPVLSSSLSNWINNGVQVQTLSSPAPISPNFTWEKSATIDGGIDAAFLQDRLQASMDVYSRKTSDMLIPGRTVPAVFGATAPTQNAGDLVTKGWDLSLSWEDGGKIASKAFRYNFGVVLSDYTAKITKFDNPNKLLSNHYVGEQLGEIWGFGVDGFFKDDADIANHQVNQAYVNKQIQSSPGEWGKLHPGDMKFVDQPDPVTGKPDGIINQGQNTLANHGDLKRIGNKLPRYSFGVRMGFSWNNFDISAMFQGIGKQNWYPGSEAGKFWGPYTRPYYSFIPKDFQSKIWTPEHPDSYLPLLRGYEALNSGGELYFANDKYLQNIAYVRLKNLTLGYNLPAGLVRRWKMQHLRVYATGSNLFTWTTLKTKYIDPEQVTPDAADQSGHEYPFFKSYTVGLNVTF